jgi:hypothetical protein
MPPSRIPYDPAEDIMVLIGPSVRAREDIKSGILSLADLSQEFKKFEKICTHDNIHADAEAWISL